ncbi:MAG: tRNA-guanine transglycosylase DpdA [Planctomycetes bacterium]|nr:tRNA-guanine transglycosylase DpdA [Planctomycetota bacterium]
MKNGPPNKLPERCAYIIPEWDDLVDPAYDFKNDEYSRSSDRRSDTRSVDVYAHELYGAFNYDGILVSKIIIDSTKRKRKEIEARGVHEYLRLPADYPTMGDCGAFGYINDREPPFGTDEIIAYYEAAGFDYAVSIDHLCVPGAVSRTMLTHEGVEVSEMEARRLKQLGVKIDSETVIDEDALKFRYELTLRNAQEFFEKAGGAKKPFVAVGAAQGFSPESYADAVRELTSYGYDHIALGGLVRSKTHQIVEILDEIQNVRKPGVRIHLFGVARDEAIARFVKLGVTSFDSASPLRRAWLSTDNNYFLPEERFAAIRIPQTARGRTAKKIVEKSGRSIAEIERLEAAALSALRDFARTNKGIERTLETLIEFDSVLGDAREAHQNAYRRTLEARPWERCPCRICKDVGVEVIIFRGNNRNRRRGFHNTHVFYESFKRTIETTNSGG